MTQVYSDPARESDPHALPDIEVFYQSHKEAVENMPDDDYYASDEDNLAGWYWWACLPGCLPDSEPNGPFKTEAEAISDARSY